MSERKYFGTDGIRGRVGENLINPEFVLKLGWAVGTVLREQAGERGKVLIGKDTRVSGYMLESALEAGFSAAGVDIRLLGPMPTPAIAYLTRTFRALAGIVISASHNPYTDNGIKFFSAEGNKLPDEWELAIEAQMEKPLVTVTSQQLGKASRIVDAPGRYVEFCKATIPAITRLNGLKIVVDCANGATYHVAPNVLRELGAEVITLGARPDGFNINRDCGSLQPKFLQQAVLAENAHLGIALDGDGDRVVMVDERGELLDGDEIIYIMALDCLKRNVLRGGVVGTVMSNLGLELSLHEKGIEFIRTQVGDRYIIAELSKRNLILGGEPSGHIVHLGVTTTGDGIISALQVLAAMQLSGKTLHQLKQGWTKFPQAKINVPVKQAATIMQSAKLQQRINDFETQLAAKGRILIRPSGTEPVIRIMVEGEKEDLINKIAKDLATEVQALDL